MLVSVAIERAMFLSRYSLNRTELCTLLGIRCETVLSAKLRSDVVESEIVRVI